MSNEQNPFVTELAASAIQMHEMLTTYKAAGFSHDDAMKLLTVAISAAVTAALTPPSQ